MKVKRLINILNDYNQKVAKPKIIIFVKDRVVAEYLKKVLENQILIRKNAPADQHKEMLDPNYSVGMAMGSQGRNHLNKAYRSIKSEDSSSFSKYSS